jgi:histone acetyltransferase (RNA polymerase elongator complex component)
VELDDDSNNGSLDDSNNSKSSSNANNSGSSILSAAAATIITKREKSKSQHVGLGTRLMQHAEKMAAYHGYGKVAVISGVGVRHYYRRLG